MTINVVVRSVNYSGKVVESIKGNLTSIEVGDNSLYIIIEPKATDPKTDEKYDTPTNEKNYKERMENRL